MSTLIFDSQDVGLSRQARAGLAHLDVTEARDRADARIAHLRRAGLTHREIAAAVGCSIGLVHGSLGRNPIAGQIIHLPIAPRRDLAWQDRAACAGRTDAFDSDDPSAALALCEGCPVRVACGNTADADGTAWGVWGGRVYEAGEQVAS